TRRLGGRCINSRIDRDRDDQRQADKRPEYCSDNHSSISPETAKSLAARVPSRQSLASGRPALFLVRLNAPPTQIAVYHPLCAMSSELCRFLLRLRPKKMARCAPVTEIIGKDLFHRTDRSSQCAHAADR